MTTSFGQCEAAMGSSENNFYNNLWAQAAAQGISSFVAAGDSGAAGCSYASASAGSGQAVSGLASTPYNVAVGGTQFQEGTGTCWASATSADGSSALGYIPERAWNESGSMSGGSGLWAGGGGASSIYAKPSWQAGKGVPADGHRDLPDVSLTAASHDGYLIRSGGGLMAAGGTSCAAPAFAGLMALVVQATGQRQGNPNPVFYQLGNAQALGTGPAVFHDTTTGGNGVPGTTGFLAAAGYDQATGLGSVDAQALVRNWTAGAAKVTASIAAPSANLTVASGAAVNFSGSATGTLSGSTFSYAWDFGDGASAAGAAASHTFSNTGSGSVARTVVFKATDNRGVSGTASRTVTVTPAPRNTVTAGIAAPAANVTVASGAAVTFAGSAKDSSASATLAYSWNFGDGASAAGASASHAFSNTGSASAVHTVTLTATDSTGVAASASRTVTVTPAPRNTVTASITAPAANVTVASGAAVTFAGSAKDSSASATLAYAWNFGDGASASTAGASHAFSNTGSTNAVYIATFTAKDSTGITASATRTVTVTPAPRNTVTTSITAPAANITVASGATVAFAGSAKDSSASATLAYSWNFGDGASAGTAGASHAFSNTGSANAVYTVTLTAKDSTGVTASASRTVTVTPAPKPLTASISLPAANLTVANGATVTFTGVATDSNPNPVLDYSWSASLAGVLRPVALANPTSLASTCKATFTNAYNRPVSVLITFAVADNQGARATATRTVTVNPAGTLARTINH
jgi:subtilase family serine protease